MASGPRQASIRAAVTEECVAGHLGGRWSLVCLLLRFVSHFLHGDHVFEHHFRLVILSTDPPDTWYDPSRHHTQSTIKATRTLPALRLVFSSAVSACGWCRVQTLLNHPVSSVAQGHHTLVGHTPTYLTDSTLTLLLCPYVSATTIGCSSCRARRGTQVGR